MAQPGFAKDHVERYRASGGVDGHIWAGFDGNGHFPCLLLTTIGRKSGEPRTTPLIYGEDNGRYIVIASKGGGPAHPGWYFNLIETPTVEVQVKDRVFTAAASIADAEERTRLWTMMAEIYPPYDAYEEKASGIREIPLVLLTPA